MRKVLIESDWNLKKFLSLEEILGMDVLIESDWNLKIEEVWSICERFYVLIESDWNLKEFKKLLKQAEEEAY